MSYCSSCGFQVDGVDNFCARCGFEIKYKEKPNDNFSVKSNNDFIAKSHNNFNAKRNPKKQKSFWELSKTSLKHTFFDSEEKLSAGRKTINIAIIGIIIILGVSIATPYLNQVRFVDSGNNIVNDLGQCNFRLDARQVRITNASYDPVKLFMEVLITNNKDELLIIENLAKTYEFRFDGRGETENEVLNMKVPPGKTLKLGFKVNKEPYILGLEFNNCEKTKVSSWKTISDS